MLNLTDDIMELSVKDLIDNKIKDERTESLKRLMISVKITKEDCFYYIRKYNRKFNTYGRVILCEKQIYNYLNEPIDENDDPFSETYQDLISYYYKSAKNLAKCEKYLRNILSGRENIPNKKQRKQQRIEKSNLRKHGNGKGKSRNR